MPSESAAISSDPADDVAEMLADLLRIDTTNPGDNSGPGEIEAAHYVQERLAEVGIESELFTTTAQHRAGVAALIPGSDPTAQPIMLTGHLDVVPAVADDWTHPPFAGVTTDDGIIYGRGAVDMKDMDAMILGVVRHWARAGITPRRPVALLFTPDEEAGGHHGAHWIVRNRPELVNGATDALGEVGGFSVALPNGRRIYPIQTGEKGLAWLTATVTGTAGHGSLIHLDNPVALLIESLHELVSHPYPVSLTPAMAEFADRVGGLIGEPLDFEDLAHLEQQVGGFARVLGACVRTTINPTILEAGYKHNIVPGKASAGMDVRFLPGTQDEVLEHIRAVLPAATTITSANTDISLETAFDGPVIDAIVGALAAADPDAVAVPYLMTGGTDGKAFASLGVRYVGFSPVLMPADGDFWSMFHGVDERVPAEGVRFGARVLHDVMMRV